MRLIFKNEKGIALLIVLSTLTILGTAVVQFAYTERINYQLAVNAGERLQSYFLARSALNFSKLLLVYQKEAEKTLQSVGGEAAGYNIEPLYRMLPLSSELIRSVISGEIETPSEEESGEKEKSEEKSGKEEGGQEEKEGDLLEQSRRGAGMLAKEEAKEFLSFEGDFSAEITEEQAKYDLNKIANLVSTSPAYDQRKRLLYSFLMLPKFEELFSKNTEDREKLVHALADWVDPNGMINEFENVQRGSEDGLYTGKDYKVKNGKMVTLSEARLVEPMTDDVYSRLENFLTVYTGSEKINLCLAVEDDWAKAIVYHYTHYAGCGRPVEYTDEEKMTELKDALLGGCPDVDAMAISLNKALGLVSESDDEDASSPTDSGSSSSSTGSTVSGCLFQVKDLLTSDNKIFSIRAKGRVGETEVNIVAIVNTDSSDPTKWKYYYYRIE